MSMSEVFYVPFHTLIKPCYTKVLEWSSLVPGPEAKYSSEITKPTPFTISYQYHYCTYFRVPFTFLRLSVWPNMWSVLEKFPRAFEKIMYSAVLGCNVLFSSVQLLSRFRIFEPHGLQHAKPPCPLLNPSLLKLMSIESVMPSNHLIFCHPLLLPPSTFPIIRVFSNDSALHIRWPKYWEFQLQHRSFQWILRTDLL